MTTEERVLEVMRSEGKPVGTLRLAFKLFGLEYTPSHRMQIQKSLRRLREGGKIHRVGNVGTWAKYAPVMQGGESYESQWLL